MGRLLRVEKGAHRIGLYNSDGVLSFVTGAVNGQYFVRWLNDFDADGPLPLTSTMDHGAELSVGHFVKPKR